MISFDRNESLSPRYISANNTLKVQGAGGKHGGAASDACAALLLVELEFADRGPLVERLVPDTGPRGGGTDVVVVGVRLRERDLPVCRFGTRRVNAHPVAEAPAGTALRCRSPALHNISSEYDASSGEQVDFAIEVGGRRVFPYPPSPAVPFFYYRQPELRAISPRQGAPDRATPVEITGSTFFTGAGQLACRFGRKIAAAHRLSPTKLACSAPPLGEHIRTDRAVEVGVALNGVDFQSASFNFTYLAAADSLETLTSQLEAMIVIVVVVAGAVVICLVVALYRVRS